jgi:hypothetical protein
LPQPLAPPCRQFPRPSPSLGDSAYDCPLSRLMRAPAMRFAVRPIVSPKYGTL